jgi:hypothetical protein
MDRVLSSYSAHAIRQVLQLGHDTKGEVDYPAALSPLVQNGIAVQRAQQSGSNFPPSVHKLTIKERDFDAFVWTADVSLVLS